MKNLIEDWERSAEKYQTLGLKATNLIRKEGLLCRSEVYRYCANKLTLASQPFPKDRDELKPLAEEERERFARLVRERMTDIRVGGHADSVDTTQPGDECGSSRITGVHVIISGYLDYSGSLV